MKPFLVCIHDATPAHARQTRAMLRDLRPLVGRRLCFGVVPDWHGVWRLEAHPDYCRLLADSADELLLHGYFHRRQRGYGAISALAERSDEMNGLDANDTRRALERGQRVFTDVFGAPARGFLPPAWQKGRLKIDGDAPVVEHIVGFFSIDTLQRRIPLATWTWDCGRWAWLGHIGHGIGWLSHALHRGVPVLAIHPRDLDRGYWPEILSLTRALLRAGHVPATPTELVESSDVEVAA